ncbi:PREDICTED: LOW QUALITY PROTEIN, partial [Prunus dulcis]
SSGKFLGFQVHQRGIDVDPEKTRALKSLSPPKNPKELKSFMGRLSYIRRFIPGLAAMMSIFTPLLKKGQSYIWSKECQETYQQVQQLIARLPTMRAPIPGLPLKLYLAATNTAVGALLAQDSHEGEESPIYYVSRQLKGVETRYPKTELLCLALVYAAQRLRHYFLAHKLQLVVKSDPVRYLLTRPVLSGRLARWLLQLSEFDIVCTTPKAIRGQAVIDMLALFPEVEESTLSKEILGELPEVVATVVEEASWTLYFDGSSTTNGGGAGVVIINPERQATALSFKLDFPCTNNVAEYEAFIMGLSTAREMGAERVKVIGDSNLVLSQLQGSFAVKEATLAPYRTAAERLINSFKQVVMEHIPGVTNRYADALATLGSKLSYVQEQPNITV